MFAKNFLKMSLKISNFRFNSSLTKLFNFVVNDVGMNFSIRNLFVSVSVSYNFGDICQLNNIQRFIFSSIFELFVNLIKDSFDVGNIGDSCFIFVLFFEFLNHHLFNILSLITYQCKNRAENLVLIV